MRVSIDNLGQVGVVRDIYSHETPPEAWSSAQNCRMGAYGLERFLGHSKVLGTDSAGWAVAPYWLFYANRFDGTDYWIGAGANKVYVRESSSPYTETNITRQSAGVDVNYAATELRKWNGGPYGGLFVLNNCIDQPQFWVPGSKLANLSTTGASPWNSAHRCEVFGAFGRYLVALNVLKGSTRYPQMVKWSHPADGGAMPNSWDETDPAVDAGEFSLQDANGDLLWMLPLRKQNFLYTNGDVWAQTYVGGGDIFSFDRMFSDQGILAAHCAAAYKNKTEMHAVLGQDDVYVHNGQSTDSILEPAMRRWFFNNIDPTHYARSFVVANPKFNEIWVCVPEVGSEQPTLALVWNWATGAIGFKDLLKISSGSDTRNSASTYGTPSIALGRVESILSETWESDSSSWETDSTVWDQQATNPASPRLLMVDRSAGKRIFVADSTGQEDGANAVWAAERVGLSILRRDRNGAPKNDSSIVKIVTEIWPRFDLPTGAEVTFYIGSQKEQTDGVTWYGPYTYTVGGEPFIPVYASGRYISIKFFYNGAAVGRFLGYDLDIKESGGN